MCAGCDKKHWERFTKEHAEREAKAAAEKPKQTLRLAINCLCGITRLLPTGLHPLEIFTMLPCPKCGTGFKGQLTDDGVQEIV